MNYHDGDESDGEDDDDDEEEEVYVTKKSHKKKGKNSHSQKNDYSKVGVDNERVRKALLLATESRTNQARLGN